MIMLNKKENKIRKGLIDILQVGDEISYTSGALYFKKAANIIKITNKYVYVAIGLIWYNYRSYQKSIFKIPKSQISYNGELYINQSKSYFLKNCYII